MALYEHVHIQRYVKLIAQLFDTCGFALSAAVGEKYEGNPVGLEVGEGAVGVRERIGAAEEDAIDTGIVSAGISVPKSAQPLVHDWNEKQYTLESKSEVGHLLVASGRSL